MRLMANSESAFSLSLTRSVVSRTMPVSVTMMSIAVASPTGIRWRADTFRSLCRGVSTSAV